MSLWSLGSAANQMFILIPDIPDSVSGGMLDIIDRARINIECYTGQTVGSVGIAEKYQPALLACSKKEVLSSMMMEGSDSNSLKLGPWSTKKGTGSNVSEALKSANAECQRLMNCLGFGTRMYKSNG